MTRLTLLCIAALCSLSIAPGLDAQVRLPVQPPIRQLDVPVGERRDSQPVPTAYRPPPGMCRIWLEGVPPAQQPAPTDCASAVRNRPSNGRVIFGDDYVKTRRNDKNDKNDRRDRRPGGDPQDPGHPVATRSASDDVAPLAVVATGPRIHGPSVLDDESATDLPARPVESDASGVVASDIPSEVAGDVVASGLVAFAANVADDQPPARRASPSPRARPAVDPDDEDEPQDPRSLSARRAERRDSVADARRRRADDGTLRRRPSPSDVPGRRDTARVADGRDRDPLFRDGVRGSGRDDGSARSREDAYREGYRDGARSGGRDGYGDRSGRDDGYGRRYDDGRYASPYDPRYAPGRANGTCLDRDGDGWCDDYRTGGGYCVDRDGDGRCDDYPGLASAPYSSALPPMVAAADVASGRGSEAALRWLGTAEVTVRTTDLRRTGVPSRAVWTDASTGRVLQVWTDRNGDGIADRVEIYRNGQVVKTIGR